MRCTYIAIYGCVDRSGAASKVTQLPVVVHAQKHILRFDISMGDGWFLHMHVKETLDDLRCNREHFRLWQSLHSLIGPLLN